MRDNKDYYKILGVEKTASADEIKKAYRKLAIQFHPDRQQGKTEDEQREAEERFKGIAEAYSILSDTEKRKNYDTFGTVDGMGFSSQNASDIFQMFMGSGFFDNFRQTKRANKGQSIRFIVKLTLEEIYNNSPHTIKYKRSKPCSGCGGKGTKNGKITTCPHCGGTGMIMQTQSRGYAIITQSTPCPHCGGTGEVITNPCGKCNGSGLETVEETFTFNAPSGIADGNYTVVRNMGNYPQRNDGNNGDLELVFRIVPNKSFSIDESNPYNVIRELDISILDCITGCTVEVEDLGNKKHTISIKPSTTDKSIVRVSGCGFRKPDKTRGDMFVVINHKMPSKVSKEEIDLLNKLKTMKNFK